MAPSSGHTLVPKLMKAFKYAINRTAAAVRERLAQGSGGAQPQAIPIRIGQPVHPLAALRQSRAGQGQFRNFTTSIQRAIVETYPSLRGSKSTHIAAPLRSSFPKSATSRFIGRTPGAPTFASTLRPNLTGGAIPRTAGGYGNVGGKRMFSSLPGSQAQVVNHVSAGVRAFWLGGQRGRFDGMDERTGEKRFVAVGLRQEETRRKMTGAKGMDEERGTMLEFCVNPALKAFGKSFEETGNGLDAAIAPLAVDFARSLGALAAVHRDLKKLAKLGDLPVSEVRPGWLAVRFPGCDGATVERLCDELGIYRGIVREDEAWAEETAQDVKMALLFPTAPSDHDDEGVEEYFYPTQTPSPPRYSSLEDTSYTADETLSRLESIHGSISAPRSFEHVSASRSTVSWQPNPWQDEEVSGSDRDDGEIVHDTGGAPKGAPGIQDMDSIYQFLAECNTRLR